MSWKFLVGFAWLPVVVLAADPPLTSARESVAQWVQTQQLISRTRAEWESDKEMLQQSKALFERELNSVQEQLNRISTNNSVADQERRQAEIDLETAHEALGAARRLAAALETEIKQLIPMLPPPLLATVEPLVNRLPGDPEDTKAGVTERIQNVVALLNEVDKFNNAVAVTNEKQPNEKGELVAVDVIYLGLGQAYFAAPAGNLAGLGAPGPTGWIWTRQENLAGPIRDAVAIYRSQKPAEFVPLPVAIQ